MRFGVFMAVLAATTTLVGVGSAVAQARTPSVSLSEAQAAQRNAPTAQQRRGLRLNERRRGKR